MTLRALIACFVGGFAIQWAFAVACLWWSPAREMLCSMRGGSAPTAWPCAVPQSWTPQAADHEVGYRRGPFLEYVQYWSPSGGVTSFAAGWPMPSTVLYESLWDLPQYAPNASSPSKGKIMSGLSVPALARSDAIGSRNRLPTDIRVVGTIVNTLVIASLLAGGVWTKRRIHGAWRRGRGLCVRCGYSLGSLPTCPECGTPAR